MMNPYKEIINPLRMRNVCCHSDSGLRSGRRCGWLLASACSESMAAQHSDRYARLLAKYEALCARAESGDSLVPDTAYADFLK